MRKIKEFIKSIILTFLVLSMLTMSLRIMIVDRMVQEGTFKSSVRALLQSIGLPGIADFFKEESITSDITYSTERFIYPSFIVVRNNEGVFAAAYNRDNIINAFSGIKNVITKVIKSNPAQDYKKPFSTLITEKGILIDTGRSLSLDIVMRVSENSRSTVKRLFFRYCFITETNNKLSVYVKNEETNSVYVFSSKNSELLTEYNKYLTNASSSQVFSPAMISSDMQFNGINTPPWLLSYKAGTLSLSPSTPSNIIYNKTDKAFNAQYLSSVLKIFGFNYNSVRRDTEKNGSVIYVENLSSITITPQGRALFSTSQPEGGLSLSTFGEEVSENGYSLQNIIVAAHKLIDSFDKRLTGGSDADLRFSNAYFEDESGTCVIDFDYVINGMPVKLSGDHPYAARIKYSDGYFTEADITFRTYAKSGTAFSPMQIDNAIILAGLSHPNKDVLTADIEYNDTGDKEMIPDYRVYFKK
ncbi:MAG: hypothetical protein Q8865_00150 [Bacillota bacterium]|nr:hypothetical protein [Bacillota bacterium]